MSGDRPLLVLGSGFTARAVAARVMARRPVRITTRSNENRARLEREGLSALFVPRLDEETLAPHLDGADVVITFPPDGDTDRRVAKTLGRAHRTVYISSTAVYGDARGRVDEETPVDARVPRAEARLDAERLHLERGAVVLRSAGIYGPERGLHLRLLRGEHRLPGDGANVVSRIHVDDLAMLAESALEQAQPGAIFNAADDAPVPQREVIAWLCARLALPLPPSIPLDQVDPSLRGDRAIDNARIKRALGVTLQFATYREGFDDCLARMPR